MQAGHQGGVHQGDQPGAQGGVPQGAKGGLRAGRQTIKHLNILSRIIILSEGSR